MKEEIKIGRSNPIEQHLKILAILRKIGPLSLNKLGLFSGMTTTYIKGVTKNLKERNFILTEIKNSPPYGVIKYHIITDKGLETLEKFDVLLKKMNITIKISKGLVIGFSEEGSVG